MEIKKLDNTEISDFRSLLEIFKEVFERTEEIPANGHLGRLLSNRDFLVFVIKINGQVIGGLTVYILHTYYSTRPGAYIYDVGITPLFQRQGAGKALFAAVCKYCMENGFEEAYVQAETEDTAAVNFYRKTSYSSEMNAAQFTYLFNNNEARNTHTQNEY